MPEKLFTQSKRKLKATPSPESWEKDLASSSLSFTKFILSGFVDPPASGSFPRWKDLYSSFLTDQINGAKVACYRINNKQ